LLISPVPELPTSPACQFYFFGLCSSNSTDCRSFAWARRDAISTVITLAGALLHSTSPVVTRVHASQQRNFTFLLKEESLSEQYGSTKCHINQPSDSFAAPFSMDGHTHMAANSHTRLAQRQISTLFVETVICRMTACSCHTAPIPITINLSQDSIKSSATSSSVETLWRTKPKYNPRHLV
jgi:hypothetical protein